MIDEHQRYNVLVVGDRQSKVGQLVRKLRHDHTVFYVHSRKDAEKALQKDIAIAIADQRVIGQPEQDVIKTIAISPETLWILLGEQADSEIFTKALQDGTIYHYVSQPWQSAKVYNLAKRALEHKQVIEELHRLKAQSRVSQIEMPQTPLKPEVAGENHQNGISPSTTNSEANCQELQEILKKGTHSEKMATLGQMVAEVAHEINTPSGAINAAVVNINHHLKLLLESFREFDQQEVKREHLQQVMHIVEKMLTALDEKPRRTPSEVRTEQKNIAEKLQQQDVQNSRKIAKDIARMGLAQSLDEFLAIASFYDIDSILMFFNNCSRIINSAKDIKLSIDFLNRYAQALKSYSRPWQARRELADIHESIETALIILNNKLKHRIEVDFRQADVPDIWCYSSELSHVWLNIIHNAIQAIEGKGKITIETFATGQHLGVRITDTGAGIPKDVQPRIFDVNFTTKPHGKGTGLGLYIVHQIIEKHDGTISVASVPGQTTFEVCLPLSNILRNISNPAKD